MQQYSKDRQLGKKTSTTTARTQLTPQGFWADGTGDDYESREPILEVSSARRMPQPEPVAPRLEATMRSGETPPVDDTPTPTKDYPLRRLPIWVFSALNDLAQKRAKEAHLVQSSVNAEILTALEQYVISKGYRRDS